ncbi:MULTISPECIES: hypothetical protein [Streptomyces]|uniref:hypothetical protein n=1 Tax=Streptomyces TaxID=1883 RepID=UPI000AB67021|nr:hypothetical protein [Streptomyces rubrolavendulae]
MIGAGRATMTRTEGRGVGEEPSTWGELLLSFALVAAVPTVVGGAVVLTLVGLTVWLTAPLRRRRRPRSGGR